MIKTNYMKRLLLLVVLQFITLATFAQQIPNSDFESWENVASATEPVNWNSFLTAQGSFTGFAANQIEASSDVRPGSSGVSSCRINSRDAGFNIKANGNVTLGRVNMGSSTPSSPDNHNISLTNDANFSEAFTGTPDSIIFWVKFTSSNDTDSARMKAVIHDAYNYKDPEDAASLTHIRAKAVRNFKRTNGNWLRISVPFVSVNSNLSASYILITFTTNKTPGGGNITDVLLIDDVTLHYNVAPVVNSDSYVTTTNTAVNCPVLGNDSDATGSIQPGTITITTQPAHGTVTVNPTTGVITYTPANNYVGSDSFVYSACDNGYPVLCDDATVTLTVNAPVNNAPDAVLDYYFTPMNVAKNCPVLSNDTDVENGIVISTLEVIGDPSHGTYSLNSSTGEILYTPDNGFVGIDTFIYKICDNGIPSPVLCDSVIVKINVYNPSVNQQVIAVPDEFSGQHDTQIECAVLANDSDPENNFDFTSVQVIVAPVHGTVSVNTTNGVITYTPSAGYSGADVFTYRVSDLGLPTTTDTADVTIDVTFLDVSVPSLVVELPQFKFVGDHLIFSSKSELNGTYQVVDLVGKVIQKGKLTSAVDFEHKSGVYLIFVETPTGRVTKRMFKN